MIAHVVVGTVEGVTSPFFARVYAGGSVRIGPAMVGGFFVCCRAGWPSLTVYEIVDLMGGSVSCAGSDACEDT